MMRIFGLSGRQWADAALESLLAFAAALLALEGLARLWHSNERPLLPFIVDAEGEARGPAEVDFVVRLPRSPAVRYATDHSGARIADDAARSVRPGWLFVGDSQMLGWGLDFAQSLPGQVARNHGMSLSEIRVLASSRQEPAGIRGWARHYARSNPHLHKLVAVGVNLGNDLDELIARNNLERPSAPNSLVQWLSLHSFAFLDAYRMRQTLLGWKALDQPAGLNAAVLLHLQQHGDLDGLAQLAEYSVLGLLAELPPAQARVVVLFPQDTQVSLSEFGKYRAAYGSQQEFEKAHALQVSAVAVLDEVGSTLAARLRAKGIAVVELAGPLKESFDPELFDRFSHHLTARGIDIAARSLRLPQLPDNPPLQ